MDTTQEANAAVGATTGLIGLTRQELGAALAEIGMPAFRARQLWHWLYFHGATTFDAMTTLSKDARAQLAERFTITRPAVSRELTSTDGTRKWLVRFGDGKEAECVHIPEEDRGALCISSQVGCTLTCAFCHTGTQRLVRNLTAGEIVGQIMVARDSYGEWPGRPHGRAGRRSGGSPTS
jgi:23S rRNA (adenine2503-C2)-methyltransferase